MHPDTRPRCMAGWQAGRLAAAIALVCALSGFAFGGPAVALEGAATSAVTGENDEEKRTAREKRQNEVLNFTPDPELATLYIMREKSLKGAAVKSKIYLNGWFAG